MLIDYRNIFSYLIYSRQKCKFGTCVEKPKIEKVKNSNKKELGQDRNRTLNLRIMSPELYNYAIKLVICIRQKVLNILKI